jgi:ADP-ribose pyrophosphatase
MNKLDYLPENAKLVHRGVIFDVYQWEQEMFNGSFATFERIVRPDTAAVILIDGDHVIINQETQPASIERIDLIMGRLEPGENPHVGALRELEEETGIVPRQLFECGSERLDGKILWWIHTFVAIGVKEKKVLHQDVGEHITNLRLTFDEFYLKCKNLELSIPQDLIKVLINESKEDFLDRFKNPDKYFKKVEIS